MGLAWMGGILWLTGIKINFLNFIAIPITLGIGVDYSINMVHRWRAEAAGNVPTIVRETGGAIVLCSLTTVLGYTALIHSVNSAVRSFGVVAVIGELTCIASVMLVLPAVFRLVERKPVAPLEETSAKSS
jgi:predicted RND superfamily exporter protein